MGAFTTLQELTTIKGTSATTSSVTQPVEKWQDVGNWADAIFTLWVMYASKTGGDTLTMTLYTTSELDSSQASAKSIATFSTVTTASTLKKKVILTQDSWPIERYVFWKLSVSGTAGAYEVQFRINNMLKRPA